MQKNVNKLAGIHELVFLFTLCRTHIALSKWTFTMTKSSWWTPEMFSSLRWLWGQFSLFWGYVWSTWICLYLNLWTFSMIRIRKRCWKINSKWWIILQISPTVTDFVSSQVVWQELSLTLPYFQSTRWKHVCKAKMDFYVPVAFQSCTKDSVQLY